MRSASESRSSFISLEIINGQNNFQDTKILIFRNFHENSKFAETENKFSKKVPSKVPSKTESEVLELMKKTPYITRTQIMEQTGLSDGGVKKIISRMKSNGWVMREGSPKTGYWKIIYQE